MAASARPQKRTSSPAVPTSNSRSTDGAQRSARVPAQTAPASAIKRAPARKSFRSTAIVALVVPGLFATVALPAYAVAPDVSTTETAHSVAEGSAQTLVVSSASGALTVNRDVYAATTPEEIAAAKKAKEEAEAAAAAKKAAEAALASGSSGSTSSGGSAIFGAIAGSGAVRYPLAVTATIGDGFGSRGGAHNGVDMLCAGGTAIGAIADGVVRISSESYFGYGVAVVIDHVINGQTVSTLYGHMTYGTRTVQVGQTVSAGQIIGQVGSTGRSTANHLHLEVKINGSLVDPMAWLRANGVA
ncbi:murein DD-endopeptidase MepM/ murein hydrolase activator NlpD [Labedella gwakjiensis]|uniref:M23 family metallopeptidase n=1 Tax=Labedella gwakjiensis TaxID=390269 RepID=A0A2P8GRH4_9MICO|nr:M23 family metallopeptidase [Labedella gwakjiensis]PSL36566.1 murein DD-endopeptidase MepM/ murein hydrolase activator NlpD [Labedella gwakjiensis]RUQ85523.1 M23 family metallopeptidase [Labedella gwakjiensis]